MALQLAGVKTDDEVITQPLTFVATVNAISYNNATPVFVDVNRETLGLCSDALEEFLEKQVNNTELGAFNKQTGTLNKLMSDTNEDEAQQETPTVTPLPGLNQTIEKSRDHHFSTQYPINRQVSYRILVGTGTSNRTSLPCTASHFRR